MNGDVFTLHPIGHVSSPLTNRADAPKQDHEGAPAAWLVFKTEFEAFDGTPIVDVKPVLDRERER